MILATYMYVARETCGANNDTHEQYSYNPD
jgi:hypothetical protein